MTRAIQEVRVDLEVLLQDQRLLVDEGFAARADALDDIEEDILERIEHLARAYGDTVEVRDLRLRAGALKDSLEEANQRLFAKLRSLIRSGYLMGKALGDRLQAYAGHDAGDDRTPGGYDSLDALVAGLFLAEPPPGEQRARERGMVAYQPTPARVVFDLVARTPLSGSDVFIDLGSGLGQVAMLVHLLTGARACGIEYEPAYVAYARRTASELGLSGVEFICDDLRTADLSGGTVFYMYTPVAGQMLEAVLHRLEGVAHARPIRLLSYGPCTAAVLRQGWLACEGREDADPDRLAVFHSAGR